MHNINPLSKTMRIAQDQSGFTLGDLTVLAPANDPFRVDTPAGRRDGEWLAEAIDRFFARTTVHLRGLHYVLVTDHRIKPNGLPYMNTEKDWKWLSEKASKAARFLGLVDFSKIVDERNAVPIVRRWEPKDPTPYLHVDVQFELPDVDGLMPRVSIEDFRGAQPFKLVLIGEKSSLSQVLAPIAQSHQADLYLPTGEISDTQLYDMARIGSEDGRDMIAFYFSDCDPAGWQMPISVGRKLQALKEGFFPDLEFQVHRVALTPEQVREYGLPSTPIKDTEKRGDKWVSAMGVAQTEIDALAALQPGLLRRLAREAIDPFFDQSLAQRVEEARIAWLAAAQDEIDDQLGPEWLAAIRNEAEERLAAMGEQLEALQESLRIDVGDLSIPIIDIPEPEIDMDGLPSPLIDSTWGFIEGSRALKAAKAYEEDED